jgi:D-3-phosphoglycerate dehydrogenase
MNELAESSAPGIIGVLVAAEIDPVALHLLGSDDRFRLTVRPAYSPDALVAALGSHQVLVTRYQNQVTAEVVRSSVNLRLVVQGTSGLDNIDQVAAALRNVHIVGIPGENANAVAELVIGLAISLTRTVGAYDREVRTGVWNRGDCATRRELRGYRLGIVGLGRVGSAVARLARTFAMTIRAFDPYLTPSDFEQRGAAASPSLSDLLGDSDIVTLHVPLTEETRRILGRRELDLLPAGAFIINASRGPVLDTDAVLAALAEGKLGGVGLDVYESEPPERSWPHDSRLILTPHIAGCSAQSKESIGRLIYARICEHFGLLPRTVEPAS